MTDVAAHYSGDGNLVGTIRRALEKAGKDISNLTALNLTSIDEFHIRGRKATLELADLMALDEGAHLLDIGSGLGGPARTMAETVGCRVTGVDLTPSFCEAAEELSRWVGLADKVRFQVGDATALPFDAASFDAAMTIHVAMNIPDKLAVYKEARRVLKPNRTFGIYDIIQGEGGDVLYPVPWAREPSISHLATSDTMRSLLGSAGFQLVEEIDTTGESQSWFTEVAARMAASGPPPITFKAFLGDDFPLMARNQVRNLAEKRIRTVTYICRAVQ